MEKADDMTPMLDPDMLLPDMLLPDVLLADVLLADVLLAEAAAIMPVAPDAAFMARLTADAQRLQPPRPMPTPPRAVVPQAQARPSGGARLAGRGTMLDALADVFGGRGALAAMMLATVTGLYVGVAQPSALTSLTGLSSDAPLDSLDLMSGSDRLWKETTP